MRHTACGRALGDCDCECHDNEDVAQAAARLAAVSIGPGAPPAAERAGPEPRAAALELFPCRAAGCSHRPFSTEQGERVHYARVHGPQGSETRAADTADEPPPESGDFDMDDEAVTAARELLGPGLSPLVVDACEAVAFLENRDPVHVLAEVIDRWAAETIHRDVEVKAIVEIRRRRREAGT